MVITIFKDQAFHFFKEEYNLMNTGFSLRE